VKPLAAAANRASVAGFAIYYVTPKKDYKQDKAVALSYH
jgi:hypothetical protein